MNPAHGALLVKPTGAGNGPSLAGPGGHCRAPQAGRAAAGTYYAQRVCGLLAVVCELRIHALATNPSCGAVAEAKADSRGRCWGRLRRGQVATTSSQHDRRVHGGGGTASPRAPPASSLSPGRCSPGMAGWGEADRTLAAFGGHCDPGLLSSNCAAFEDSLRPGGGRRLAVNRMKKWYGRLQRQVHAAGPPSQPAKARLRAGRRRRPHLARFRWKATRGRRWRIRSAGPP